MLYLPAGITAAIGYDARDLDGQPRAGLTVSDFAVDLRTGSDGVTYSAAPEAVSVVESGIAGWYEFRFTPALAQRYLLTITPTWAGAAGAVRREEILFGKPSIAFGLAYATKDQVKGFLGPDFYRAGDTSDDDTLETMLGQATATIDAGCGRSFWQELRTEYPRGGGVMLRLRHYPIASIASVHVSPGIPRAYDAGTLLADGTDYVVDWEAGLLERIGGAWPDGTAAVRVSYTAGEAEVPELISRACVLLVAYWRANTRAGAFESMSGLDGSVVPGTNAAWYAEARSIIKSHCSQVLG